MSEYLLMGRVREACLIPGLSRPDRDELIEATVELRGVGVDHVKVKGSATLQFHPRFAPAVGQSVSINVKVVER
jgi:hypothetical protein